MKIKAFLYVVGLGLLLVACGGGSSTPENGDSVIPADTVQLQGAAVVPGSDEVDVAVTIGSAGGVVEGAAGTPTEGVVVTIPSGIYEDGTIFTLGHNGGTVTPASGHSSWSGLILSLESDKPGDFNDSISITVPFSGTDDAMPVPYYINAENKLEACELTAIDLEAGTVTFETSHTSNFTVLITRISELIDAYNQEWEQNLTKPFVTGFDPEKHGFKVGNKVGKYAHYERSNGMSIFAWWHFLNHSDQPLYSSYSENDQEVLASRSHFIFKSSEQIVQDVIRETQDVYEDYSEDDYKDHESLAVLHNLLVETAEAVLVLLYDQENGTITNSRTVVVYGYWKNQFFVYDPSYPGETKILTIKNGQLVYGSKHVHMLEKIIHTTGIIFDVPKLYNEAQDGFTDFDATIKNLSKENGALVMADKINVTGIVESGGIKVEEIWVKHMSGGQGSAKMKVNEETGAFDVELDLIDGDNDFSFVLFGHDDLSSLIEIEHNFSEELFTLQYGSMKCFMYSEDIIGIWDDNPEEEGYGDFYLNPTTDPELSVHTTEDPETGFIRVDQTWSNGMMRVTFDNDMRYIQDFYAESGGKTYQPDGIGYTESELTVTSIGDPVYHWDEVYPVVHGPDVCDHVRITNTNHTHYYYAPTSWEGDSYSNLLSIQCTEQSILFLRCF